MRHPIYSFRFPEKLRQEFKELCETELRKPVSEVLRLIIEAAVENRLRIEPRKGELKLFNQKGIKK